MAKKQGWSQIMNKKLLILLLLLCTLLSGCLASKRIESLGIINTRGVDVLDDNLIETSLIYFEFDSQTKEIIQTVSGIGKTIKGARANANFKTSYQLSPGQIRLELYGMEAAKKGLLPYLDTIARDARVANTMFLAVSRVSAKELITKAEEGKSRNVGRAFSELVQQSVNDDIIPRFTLQDFMHVYFDAGKDPVLPILAVENKRPKLDAIALIKGDKYVGEIPIKDAFLINILDKTVKTTFVELELPIKQLKPFMVKPKKNEQEQEKVLNVTLSVLKGEGKTKVVDLENMKFETDIKLNFNLFEITEDVLLDNPKVISVLEKEIKKNIKQQYEGLLAKVKEVNVDPFGYGNVYRAHTADGKLTKKEWRDKFPTIDVNFNIDVEILRHGTGS